MNKQIIILLALATAVIGCNKVTVDFSYSPAEPKAGEKVTFTNNSSAGEKWDWNFGDNSTSTSKNPTHTYKKAGTFLVTLRVDSANNKTYSKSITVYDTVPTFVSSTDSILHYTDVTFTANIYNPYSYDLQYLWTLPDNCAMVGGSLLSNSVIVYFISYNEPQKVELLITQGDKQYTISKTFTIYEAQGPALLMQCNDGTIMRQRLIGERREEPTIDTGTEDQQLLATACDTMVIYNDSTFDLARMQTIIGKPVQRVQMDKMAQKWYVVTSDGLFVANFNGVSAATNITLIDSTATGAIYVDNTRNSLYWANDEGLFGMALIKSISNKFTTLPDQYNSVENINRIAYNSESH